MDRGFNMLRLTITLRSAEEKADLERSWMRPDEDFFAAGACHVLAGAFMRTYPRAGLRPLMILPTAGLRGSHVLVANGSEVFDGRGWNDRADFLRAYSVALRALVSNWSYELVEVDDPIGWAFCRAHGHRHPSEFFRDPLPRAKAFLRRFIPPG